MQLLKIQLFTPIWKLVLFVLKQEECVRDLTFTIIRRLVYLTFSHSCRQAFLALSPSNPSSFCSASLSPTPSQTQMSHFSVSISPPPLQS